MIGYCHAPIDPKLTSPRLKSMNTTGKIKDHLNSTLNGYDVDKSAEGKDVRFDADFECANCD